MEVLGKGTSPCVYTAFGVKQETLVAGLTPILVLYQYYDSAFLSAGHDPVMVSVAERRLDFYNGTRSQNQKPSRSTFSPTVKLTGRLKIGPSKVKEWNSPFSPAGSTLAGNSDRNRLSITLPQNSSPMTRGSQVVMIDLKQRLMNDSTNSRESRFQIGNTPFIPAFARFCSR